MAPSSTGPRRRASPAKRRSPPSKTRAEPGPAFPGAELTIDLDAIGRNFRLLGDRLGSANCAAVVKADAYGLGAGPVGRALARVGCDRFFISSVDEGIALRRDLSGVAKSARIHVLTGLPEGGEQTFAEHGLSPVLFTPDQIDRWSGFARRTGQRRPALVKVDTGMTRLGLTGREINTLVDEPSRLEGIDVEFLMSHLACADSAGDPMNAEQRAAFDAIRARFPGWKSSLANSAGIFLGPEYHYEMARPGAALYGIAPRPHEANPMHQVVGLRGKILQIRVVDTNIPVGYGAAQRMKGPGRLATVAVGYADGFMRALGLRGAGYVGKTKVPVVGRISMDMTVFDVSDVPSDRLHPGDHVDLICEAHTVDDLAAEAGTIGYEILTSLGGRYRRTYLGGS